MPELLHSLIEKNCSRRKWRKYQLSNDLNLVPGINSFVLFPLSRLICCINLIHLWAHLHVQMRFSLAPRCILGREGLIIVSPVFIAFFVIQFIKVAKCHNKKSEKIMWQRLINTLAGVCVAFLVSVTWSRHDAQCEVQRVDWFLRSRGERIRPRNNGKLLTRFSREATMAIY